MRKLFPFAVIFLILGIMILLAGASYNIIDELQKTSINTERVFTGTLLITFLSFIVVYYELIYKSRKHSRNMIRKRYKKDLIHNPKGLKL